MKFAKFKQLSSLGLCIVLIIGCFSACKGKTTSSEPVKEEKAVTIDWKVEDTDFDLAVKASDRYSVIKQEKEDGYMVTIKGLFHDDDHVITETKGIFSVVEHAKDFSDLHEEEKPKILQLANLSTLVSPHGKEIVKKK